MGKEFPLKPFAVPRVHTPNRCIKTKIPVPESIPILEQMRSSEPRSMQGQPPILWHRAEGTSIYDPYGNQWIDFSSGVLVTASGYGHPRLVGAMSEMLQSGVYHAFCFPTEIRSRLASKLSKIAPRQLKKVFLLTTGSEAVECCIKLARMFGLQTGGKQKNILISFENAFHGRTMGSQLAGGLPGLKTWLGEPDPRFIQVPFPDEYRTLDNSFEGFERSLAQQGVDPERVCGVLSETYQGCNAKMWPVAYARAMREWCDKHKALLIFDEVQAGFGRTGKWFGFQHLGVVPDLAALGKGISGGMPLSAVIGREDVMDQYGPGEMSSTHSANTVCCAAALANIGVIECENLVERAARLGQILAEKVLRIQEDSHGHIGRTDSVGLVAALQFTVPGTQEPDPDTAWEATKRVFESGVMLFAPVGLKGSAIKINPPLVISEDSLREGLEVVQEAVRSVTEAKSIAETHPN